MRIGVLLAIILVGACSTEPQAPLVATDVVVTRPIPGMQMSAAYLSLTNHTDETIRISRVVSTQYESVQLHESIVKDGVARMRAIPVLEIPAGETITLQRGGKHLMLMQPTGATESVSLQFLDGDNLVLAVDATFEPKTTR
jgi:copper(I)-binding protein